MKYFLTCMVISVLNFYASVAVARDNVISGRVLDEAGKVLPDANIILLRAKDSSLIKTEVTNDSGFFRFVAIADGAYLVKVAYFGYATYLSAPLTVSGDKELPAVKLKQDATQLKEATVRAQKPFIEVHADKIVVNVENSIVSTGGSALDVLAHSPGVTVDQNDNISLKGKQGVNVMINGKIQPISADELANLLKSMPANAIESIELISNPSAKYEAAGTAGIINIKLKKDSKIGLNGSVNVSYAQGVYGKSGEGFNLNYRNRKFNFFANYNHSDREGFNHLTLQRTFYTDGTFAGGYNQDNNYLYHISSDIGAIGMDYNVSSKTTLGFVLNGDVTNFRRDGHNHSDIIDSVTHAALSHFTTDNASPNTWGSYSANINLRHNFDTAGKTLAVDVDYAIYPNRGTQDYITNYDSLGIHTLGPLQLHGNLKGMTDIRSLKADYTNPLKNNAKIEAGVKLSYVTADNDLQFSNLVGNVYYNDPTKTDHFIYTENINAGYINLSKDWTGWSTQLGLRAEQTVVTGNDKTTDSSFTRNYVQLFPSLSAQRHIDKDNDLGLTLSRRIERPNYEQLNPFKYYLDPTTYKAGYPYLDPALSYAVELSHTFKQKFITSLNYVLTKDPLTEVIQPSPTEYKVTIQTTKNLTSMAYYGASGSYQFQLYKWWNNTTNVNVYYAVYKGDIAGTQLDKGAPTFDAYSTNTFLLPKDWSAEISGFYQAPQVYGYMDLKPTWMLNAGVQKNLFHKTATIRLNATDIFWHGYPRATSYYSNYTESFIAQRDTRQVSLSFTYRFGKRTLPQGTRHNGGAEDEKKRMGGQGG